MAKVKSKKRKIAELIICVICVIISAVSIFSMYQDMQRQIAEWQALDWFVFSNDDESFAEATYMTTDEIKEYKTTTDIYNSGYYYEKLSEEEKVVYKAYQYALDNNFVYTYVDNSMISGKYTPLDIIVFLSLDSATIQQNISSIEYTSSHTIMTEIYGREITKDVDGYLISADTFAKDKVEKVNQSVEKLKKVDFKFTEKTTEKEKAKKIFEYVDKNVDYSEKYEKNKGEEIVHDFLYDAVFNGETNCDGFANMYSVLCALNGVECFEKVSSPPDEKTEGHTWNVVSIDGKWYNVDCTEAIDEKGKDAEISRLLRFGFSDKLQSDKPDYKELLPECSGNIVPVKKFFKSCKDSDAASFVSKELRNSKGKYVIIAVENYSDKQMDNLMQKVANRLYTTIYASTQDNGEYTLCYIYKK